MGNKVYCLWDYKMVLSLWLKICHFFCIYVQNVYRTSWVHLYFLWCACVQGCSLGIRPPMWEPQKETASHRVALTVCLEVGPCEISSFHVGMSTSVVAMLILFRQLHCWEFTGATSLSLSPCRLSPSYLFLRIFLLFCNFSEPWLLGCTGDKSIGVGYSTSSYPLYLTSCRFL